MHGMPTYVLDVPGTRTGNGGPPGAADVARDRAYVLRQLQELIALCEQVTGMRFDIDRLRECMRHANAMAQAYHELLELNRAHPAPFNAVTDGTVYLGVANAFRGTPAGAAYFRDLVEEMRGKVAAGLGTLREEKYRLVFAGVPCYPIFRRFNEMFLEWGGAFVSSTYLWFASGGTDLAWEYDLKRPLESLADGVLASVQHAMDSMFFQDRLIESLLGPFAVDGVVYHPIKSCRTVSTGLADGRRALTERTGVASLFIESDMMDRRVVSEAQLKNRIDAFFEGLAAKKARG
jgi:benzoyl-CoA reductase subunit B